NLLAGESGLTNQPVSRLDVAGVWRQVANLSTTRANAGQSYWIRCVLPAQRAGTIQVEPSSLQGLSFVGNGAEQSLRIRNTSAGARNISVRLLPSASPPAGQPALAGPVPLEYWLANFAGTNFQWTALSAPLSFTALPAGQEWNIRLGVRRSAGSIAAPGWQWQSLLEVTDDLGTRWVIPVNANPAASSASAAARLKIPQTDVHAGLWVGE